MNRTYALVMSLALTVLAAGCSGTAATMTSSAEKDQTEGVMAAQPDWFEKKTTSYNAETITAYGSAIGKDSVATAAKAVESATMLLKQSISDKLELVRSDAVRELGSASGLDDPGFLIALRKADNAVADVASVEQNRVASLMNNSNLRGYAKVILSKEELIARLDKRLGSHEKAWNSLKNSNAFEEF